MTNQPWTLGTPDYCTVYSFKRYTRLHQQCHITAVVLQLQCGTGTTGTSCACHTCVNMQPKNTQCRLIDWAAFNIPLVRDRFLWVNDPTNSVKALKEVL